MISYWNVDHGGEVSKATQKKPILDKQVRDGAAAGSGVLGYYGGKYSAAGGIERSWKIEDRATDAATGAWDKSKGKSLHSRAKAYTKGYVNSPGIKRGVRGGAAGAAVGAGTAYAGAKMYQNHRDLKKFQTQTHRAGGPK